MDPVQAARTRLGEVIFARVAGPEGAGRRERIHGAEGPRRFGPEEPIWRVHADSSMFVGGIRALLLQSLHPLAMAAVDEHSGFRGDPWGRLQRTSTFLAETTFGTIQDADRAVAVVRAVHEHVRGTAPDGRPYAASDPELLRWVHVAEVDSFLRAHDRYGSSRLAAEERDLYVEQAAVTGEALGATEVPRSTAELAEAIADFRPRLASTPAARSAARFLLIHPPVPMTLRAPYGALAAAAAGLLPRWARLPLRLPWLPITENTAIRGAGIVATSAIRWAMSPPEPSADSGTGPRFEAE
ncbi:hypothetical protein BHE97_02205 [Aeromicrobium sp. PE09-221]|uniref:oxygenase MpaB family protein n=1 Tax=Aeromicrobium sp. PE09-221 TaxID=1898043 RepID=UPI000B3EB974|nr:oxygenase MpaB family protein [Aeromicrobium sp. PE09-221]OUZ12534.1 hypothetical protein BHE97_02205 [Aeromicrobium sp. PE09-221]